MKILWISNELFPDLANAIGQRVPTAGGWMYGLAKDLVKNDIELSVATVRPTLEDNFTELNGINYHLINGKKSILYYDSTLENKWKVLITKIRPDVVHIHGTEYAHGLSLIKACPNLNYVVSIQGMISVYSRYYSGQIPLNDIVRNITLKDILRKNSIWHAERKFRKRGNKIEIPYLKSSKHFIGRTQWDHDHVVTVNPDSEYHFCNESLRDYFYKSEKWKLESCSKHTIFLSQALYPIKGLHKVLEALEIVKESYPNSQVRIAGLPITKTDTFKDWLRLDGYGKYIKNKIKKNDLVNNVTFTGPLDQIGMAKEYLNCNIFICPSYIENSPNSLGEAQLLGVPCIASYVGGIPDMVTHGQTGLMYRFEEVEMLAQHIMRVFEDDNLARHLGTQAEKVAKKRHNREINCQTNINIYETILAKSTQTTN